MFIFNFITFLNDRLHRRAINITVSSNLQLSPQTGKPALSCELPENEVLLFFNLSSLITLNLQSWTSQPSPSHTHCLI